MSIMPVRVLLFGPPRLETPAATPPLPRARGRALLAYLGATPNAGPSVYLSLIHISEPTRPY